MHQMNAPHRFKRSTPIVRALVLFLFTALCGFSAVSRAELDQGDCEGGLLSKRSLKDWSIGEVEMRHWLSRPDSAPIFRAAAKLEASLREPPKEALEVLTLLAYTQLGDKASVGSLLKHFSRWPGVHDAEVILGVELDKLGPYLTNLFLANRFAKNKDTREWLQQLLQSPIAMMIVAKAMGMAALPDRSHREMFSRDGTNSGIQLATDRIMLMRSLGSGDLVLRDLVRSTPGMAWLFSKNMFNTKYRVEKDKQNWMLRDRMALIEWTAKRLRGLDAGPPLHPEWTPYYTAIFKLVQLPLKRWPKSLIFQARDYTLGDAIFIEQVQESIYMFETDPKDDFIRQMLIDGPRQGAYLRTDAVLITRMMVALAGTRLPSLSEFRGVIRRSTAEAIESLKTLVPVQDSGSDTGVIAPSPETEAFSLPDGDSDTGLDDQTSVPSDDVFWDRSLITNYIGERFSAADLEPEREYRFAFKAPHHRFVGEQRVVFSKRALKEFINYKAVGIEAETWLKALTAGIVVRDGAKGIKLLVNLEGGDLPFEVKLVSSAYRLLGHWRNGVWHVEDMEVTH